jgi:deazaflavin-dependent oxidoreductase (nitroreductase family)
VGAHARAVNRFSATRFGTLVVKHVASPLDPWIFKATNGRWTITGRPTLPMLSLTVVGRHSGQPRTVQLAYEQDGGSYLVVASSMGSATHPGWRYNLEAAGGGTVRLRGRVEEVTATVLSDDEKAAVWPRIRRTIPQMATYEQRTDRNIRVFRLTPVGRTRPS